MMQQQHQQQQHDVAAVLDPSGGTATMYVMGHPAAPTWCMAAPPQQQPAWCVPPAAATSSSYAMVDLVPMAPPQPPLLKRPRANSSNEPSGDVDAAIGTILHELVRLQLQVNSGRFDRDALQRGLRLAEEHVRALSAAAAGDDAVVPTSHIEARVGSLEERVSALETANKKSAALAKVVLDHLPSSLRPPPPSSSSA